MKYFLIFLAALILAACDCGSCNTPQAEKKVVWVSPTGDTAMYYDRLMNNSPDGLIVHKFLGRKYQDDFFLVEFYGSCVVMDDSRRIFMPAKCPGESQNVIHDTIKVTSPCSSVAESSSKWSMP